MRGDSSQPPLPPAPAQRAVDLLADLPTDVLDQLLAGLPAQDLVRTSVLWPPWCRRWESVPGLDVDLHGLRAWDSAARFLHRCAAPLGGVPMRACHRADRWVRLAAAKRPRLLSLDMELPEPVLVLLPSLFRCDAAALAELELRSCAIPAPPAEFAGFHGLTRLDLDDVYFNGANAAAQLEAMVAASAPTLVELRLQGIVFFPGDGSSLPTDRWVIQAPNLRRLVLCLWIAGAGHWELAPLPMLETARIFLYDSAEDKDYVKTFTAISSVRELHIGNFRMATQAAAMNIFGDLLCRFKNLRILRVDGNFYESPTDHLLILSPSLETVEIKSWY